MLWVCLGCGTRYAAGLAACPHCGGTECVADWEMEAGMAKITTGGGPSFHPEVPAVEDADAPAEVPAAETPAAAPEAAVEPVLVPEPEPVKAPPSLSKPKDE